MATANTRKASQIISWVSAPTIILGDIDDMDIADKDALASKKAFLGHGHTAMVIPYTAIVSADMEQGVMTVSKQSLDEAVVISVDISDRCYADIHPTKTLRRADLAIGGEGFVPLSIETKDFTLISHALSPTGVLGTFMKTAARIYKIELARSTEVKDLINLNSNDPRPRVDNRNVGLWLDSLLKDIRGAGGNKVVFHSMEPPPLVSETTQEVFK